MRSFSGKSLLTVSMVVTLSCVSASVICAQQATNDTGVMQIQALLKQYEASIDAADTGLVEQIWSHSPEVIFIEPRGTEHGVEEVKAFVSGTFGKIFSKRELSLEKPEIHVYGETAWSDMTWTFHATIRANGAAITTKGRETQIYRKENGTWHIVAVHYSGPPITGEMKGF